MIKVGLIGYGYWGVNLARNLMRASGCQLVRICDQRPQRLAIAQENCPGVQLSLTVEKVLEDTSIDALVIATPVHTHYAITKAALLAGRHVLVEKPLTNNLREAQELVEIASKRELVLAVDHTFLFTDAVAKLKSLINQNELGNLQYFDSTRINLGLFQSDINVVWDLAPHDISILNHLVAEKPLSVSCTGKSFTDNKLESIAYLSVNYSSNFIAHFTCSWVSPVKIRKILIGGDKKMCLYDDVEPTEKLKIYDTGFDLKTEEEKHKMLVDYRVGDVFMPKIAQGEALQGMVLDFIRAIENKSRPLADGVAGLDVVKILHAAQKSIDQKGKEVYV